MAICLIAKRAERAAIIERARALLDRCDTGGADAELSAQEDAELNKHLADIAAIDRFIYSALASRAARRARLVAIETEPDYSTSPEPIEA